MEGLSARAGEILALLVREYIETGAPVGSGVLVRRGGLDLSSATVRSVLAQLEDQGFVRQPHTSAGRVPTDRGYRFYVDLLLRQARPSRAAVFVEAELRRSAGSPPLIDELMVSVPHVLSRAARYVAFALTPVNEHARFRQVEFVSLSGSKILVVLGTSGGQVTQKVVDIGEVLQPSELHQAANYLNTEFGGLSLLEVRQAVIDRLQHERALCDALFARALRLAHSTLGEPATAPTLLVEGTSTLLDVTSDERNELSLSTLGALLGMVEEKQRLVRILNEYLDGPETTVVIGAEHRSPDLRSFSLVAATYVDGRAFGAVGLIGPTRMRYSRTIPIVQQAARTISRLLRECN